MRTNHMKKGLTVVIIALFIGMGITPSTANTVFLDDTTPPVTTHELDPPEPDGLNGWYVSDVNVTLNATDDMSGVKEINYWVNGVPGTIPGDNGVFTIHDDGDDILVEYRAIDNAGNVETMNSFTIDMDQSKPDMELVFGFEYDSYLGWTYDFTAYATDDTSGMEYVEFYTNNKLQETITGPGPEYEWIWDCFNLFCVRGFIRDKEITDEYVRFFANIIISIDRKWNDYNYFYVIGYDEAGNSEVDQAFDFIPPRFPPQILLFQNITLPNNYTGYIGKYFIWAEFKQP